MNDRESIATWLEKMAERHDKQSDDMKFAEFHRLTAIIYRARAHDIRAMMDVV